MSSDVILAAGVFEADRSWIERPSCFIFVAAFFMLFSFVFRFAMLRHLVYMMEREERRELRACVLRYNPRNMRA